MVAIEQYIAEKSNLEFLASTHGVIDLLATNPDNRDHIQIDQLSVSDNNQVFREPENLVDIQNTSITQYIDSLEIQTLEPNFSFINSITPMDIVFEPGKVSRNYPKSHLFQEDHLYGIIVT